MKTKINSRQNLHFYHCSQGIHLMLKEKDDAIACRKASRKELRDLANGKIDSLFKNNLVLKNEGENVAIYERDEKIGVLEEKVILEVIQARDEGRLHSFEEC